MNSKKNKKLSTESEEIDKENKEKTKEAEIAKEEKDKNQPKSKKQLFERNKKTRFFYYHIMKRMDEYAFARSISIYGFLSFSLGNNLNLFLWSFILVSIYLITYRLLRFWIRRYLLYCFEFCYWGFMFTVYFLIFDPKNMKIFSTIYVCNTGLMTIAAVLFNNQTHFDNTDHLTSSWIHTAPLIVDWSIRWRHYIYPKETLEKLSFDFYDFTDIKFQYDDLFYSLLINPFIFWISWALLYILLMKVIFKGFREDTRYGDGLTDFIEFFRNKRIIGNSSKNSILKYYSQHFLFFLIGYPIGIVCFYNYYFNTIYMSCILVFLAWNTVRNNRKKNGRKEAYEDDY